MDRSDEELILAHRQGDAAAFPELVRRHADSLLSYHMRMTQDRQLAEDLFQETFRKVHERASQFQKRGRFASWLFSIAYTTAMDELRRRDSKLKLVSQDPSDCANVSELAATGKAVLGNCRNNPAQAAILAEEKAQVQRALEELPPRQRATVILVYFQGLTYNDAADALGCTLGTVKTQMFRAMKTLARTLSEAEGTQP